MSTEPSLPKVICLVGSTKPQWKTRYREVLEKLTLAGYVVQTVVWFRDDLEKFESHRPLLERIHYHKIRISDAVVLIHKKAKGKHTTQEIEFAKRLGKKIVTFKNVYQTKFLLGDVP